MIDIINNIIFYLPNSCCLLLTTLDGLNVVAVEGENLLVPRDPVGPGPGGRAGRPPRPAQPLVLGPARLPGIPGVVVQRPALDTSLAGLHSDYALAVNCAVLGPEV